MLLLIFLQFMTQIVRSSKFKNFSPVRYLEWKNILYRKFQRLKATFVMFRSHKDEENALKSLEKRSNFVLEKSGKPVRFLYERCDG